jgi:hypothetical protein
LFTQVYITETKNNQKEPSMSDTESKEKRSKRLHKEETVIKKQQKIALQHGADRKDVEREPHRFAKHHAMDCGNPECFLCDNPRHNQKHGETKQEKSFEQTKDWND